MINVPQGNVPLLDGHIVVLSNLLLDFLTISLVTPCSFSPHFVTLGTYTYK